MKKLAYALLVAVSLLPISCGGGTDEPASRENTTPSKTTKVRDAAAQATGDSTPADTTATAPGTSPSPSEKPRAVNQEPADAQAPAPRILAFTNVQVFDGHELFPATTVLVQDGTVARVDDVEIPEGAEVIDAAGQTLLPGLIDSHTHAFDTAVLEQAAVFGVTTELDMFSSHEFAAQMRAEQQSGAAEGRADLFSAGTLVTAPGGHGTQFGRAIPTISGPDEAAEFVAARVAEGSDYIKIIYEDGKAIGMSVNTISPETLAAVVDAAHANDKLALAHITAREAARDALSAGVDGLVHIFADQQTDDALLELAVEKGVFVIPTLTVIEGITGVASGTALLEDESLAPLLSPDDVRNLKIAFPQNDDSPADFAFAVQAVARLHGAGVPILAGTDAPNPGTAHGVSIHRELELLVEAGLSPTDALAAATSVPAKHFGLVHRGRIAPGMRADLLLVDGDPTQDIKATRRIVGVWKQGRPIDREAYRNNVEVQVAQAADAKQAPPPPGSEDGLVSDFDGDEIHATFGAGWSASTDALVGGKSQAEFQIVEGGADGTKGALEIRGTIDDRPQPRWAGAMFSPGKASMQPANLSAKKTVSFWAKGDGNECSLMLFFQSRGFQPSMKTFTAPDEWTQYTFNLADFDGCDGTDILGLFFGGGDAVGPFKFQIDQVRID